MSEIIVRQVDSGKDLDQIFEVRQDVFVDEQMVDPELEYDEFEDTSTHYLAEEDGVVIGTARWRHVPNGIKLERFAVRKNYRNRGIGGLIVAKILDNLPSKENVYLHSQVRACSLYRRYGFVEEGDQFEEAGIQHYKMVLNRT